MPLRRIGTILRGATSTLDDIVRQRWALERRREELDCLLHALRQAERQVARQSNSDILDALIDGLTMQTGIDEMRKYYSDKSWPEARRYYEQWPSAAWRTLYEDVTQVLDAEREPDPASHLAQSFATRWLELVAQDTALPGVRLGHRRAWADRLQWPAALRSRFDELKGERVSRFVAEAIWERWDAERAAREDSSGVRARVSDARRRLYHDGRALVGQDPSSAGVRELLARWEAIIDEETGGDGEMRNEMLRSFEARRRWPAGLVRSIASSYDLDAAMWSAVADLLETARERTTQ